MLIKHRTNNIKKYITAVSLLAIAAVFSFALNAKDIVSAATVSPYSLVSVNNTGDGQGGNGHSGSSKISMNGRYVAFDSSASNLIANDTNGVADVFVRDLKTNQTSRASTSSLSVQSDKGSSIRAISETGRYVVYQTQATTLEAGANSNAVHYTYLHDMKEGANTLITNSGWAASFIIISAVSDDGRLLFGQAWPPMLDAGGHNVNGYRSVMYDVVTSTWTRLGQPLSGGEQQTTQEATAASCDGSEAAFVSKNTNLVPTDNNGTTQDIFLVDTRMSNRITNITHNFNGDSHTPRLSCNGKYLMFSSNATNIVNTPSVTGTHLYRYDRINGTYSLVDKDASDYVYYGPVLWQITDEGKAVFWAKNSSDPFAQNKYAIKDIDNNAIEFITGTIGIQVSSMDKDGKKFTRNTTESNVISSDTNGYQDVFISQIN